MEKLEPGRSTMASQIRLMATLMASFVLVVAVVLATYSVVNLGWPRTAPLPLVIAAFLGAVGSLSGLQLRRKLCEAFSRFLSEREASSDFDAE